VYEHRHLENTIDLVCAFREQEDDLPSLLVSFPNGGG
jgi:hypothetical protein